MRVIQTLKSLLITAEKDLAMKLSHSSNTDKGPFTASMERANRRLQLQHSAGDHLHACKVQSQHTHYQIRVRQTNWTETTLQPASSTSSCDVMLQIAWAPCSPPQKEPGWWEAAGKQKPCSAGTNTLWNFISALANSLLPAPRGERAGKRSQEQESLFNRKKAEGEMQVPTLCRHTGNHFLKRTCPVNLNGEDFTTMICSRE